MYVQRQHKTTHVWLLRNCMQWNLFKNVDVGISSWKRLPWFDSRKGLIHHSLVITLVQIVPLSRSTLSPGEGLRYTVETSRSMTEVITQYYRETNGKQIPLYSCLYIGISLTKHLYIVLQVPGSGLTCLPCIVIHMCGRTQRLVCCSSWQC